ncbi:probable Regulator of G-Protein Signaling Protein [Ustilago trichophora]|uniref:Probable Regulator of G-Protein Signaling Protein n=1 Tax=Ustilago trichophora TaxID=86804 RepID=A0A5C3EBU7_9BASI|nr:probable Regulator of G-Protein Signaling Protein [Ustilago trichophora]
MAPTDSSGSLPGDLAHRTKQQTTSRMMKTTRRGRPFAKDTHDLFATLIVSLELGTHRQYFKTYHNSFTTDEAAENLSHLKFSQSNRVPDPNEPSRVVTTTTTTTFSMNRDMAKGICQHFMDARLIENAGDATNPIFKDKGVYVLTPKGLHILERFITKNGINGDHLLKVFSSQPICMKLLHLERRATDDELLINTPVLEVIFRRFVGRAPNYENAAAAGARSGDHAEGSIDRTLGMEMGDVQEKVKGRGYRTVKHTFNSMGALDWLCDFTTVCGKDEAAEIMAHFQRLDLIRLVLDKSKREVEPYDDRDVIIRVEDGRGGVSDGHFRCHSKTVYGVTDKGRQVARWDGSDTPSSGVASPARDDHHRLGDEVTSSHAAKTGLPQATRESGSPGSQDSRLARKPSTKLRNEFAAAPATGGAAGIGQGLHDSSSYSNRDSNTNRLKNILDEPALRSLFREFLRQNFCEENLSFWLDVQDFKRRFHTTSSAVAVQPSSKESKGGVGRRLGRSVTGALGGANKDKNDEDGQGLSAMEKHQQDLVSMAFVIYDTYLAPSSPCELNIDHNLRTELILYMDKILSEAKIASGPSQTASPAASTTQLSATLTGSDTPHASAGEAASIEERKAAVVAKRIRIPLHASQLQVMVRLYERIQDYIFRLMATDSVPRFIKDARFIQLVRSVEEYTEALEAGRIDPQQHAGPAVGRAVFEAMQLKSADMLAQNSNDGRKSADSGAHRPISSPQKAPKSVPAVPPIPAHATHDAAAS